MSGVEAARSALSTLRTEGAGLVDGLGLAFIESLLARAETQPEGARERLVGRASARMDALRQALLRERDDALAVAASFTQQNEPLPRSVAEAIAHQDYRSARERAKREREAEQRGRQLVFIPHLPRIAAEATGRGIPSLLPLARELSALAGDEGRVERRHKARALELSQTLSRALLRASMEHAQAPMVVARASDSAPDDAGPYNPQVLAVRALEAMAELSPDYLRAFVVALDDLAALAEIAVAHPRKSKRASKPPGPGGGGKRRAATKPG